VDGKNNACFYSLAKADSIGLAVLMPHLLLLMLVGSINCQPFWRFSMARVHTLEAGNGVRPAMNTDPELWRSLKVGDRVRFVHMPTDFTRPGYGIHQETLDAYRRLIERNRPLRVYKIDDWKLPWVQFRFRLKGGRIEYHSLAVNHDGLVRVRSRTKTQQ
jgi:hypothetical protein